MSNSKTCNKCHVEQPLDRFPIEIESNCIYYRNTCKLCRNLEWKRHKYKITLEEQNILLKRSNGKCEICGEANKQLCVDHNHETGKVRGMICHDCNISIGRVKENVATLRAMADYIERFASSKPSDYLQPPKSILNINLAPLNAIREREPHHD